MLLSKLKRDKREAEDLKRLLVRADERPLEIAVMAFQTACMFLLAFKGSSVELFSMIMAVSLPTGTFLGLTLLKHFWPIDRAM